MKRMNKLVALISVAAITLGTTACGTSQSSQPSPPTPETASPSAESGTAPAADAIVLKVSCQQPDSHANTQAMMRIKEKVERETDGKLILELYSNSVLGDYTVVFEEVMLGTIDMSFQSLAGEYDPRIELTFLPYLFTDTENRKRVCMPGSNTYTLFEQLLSDLDIQLLGVYGEGYVGIGTNVLDPDYARPDVQKKSLIRCNTADSNRLCVEGLGYPFVTMTFADTYSALQTGVADGTFGNTAESIYTNFRDVVKYFIRYKSIAENNEILINKAKWESIPEEYQKILSAACLEECSASYERAEEIDEEYCQKLAEIGVEIISLTDAEMQAITDAVRSHAWPAMQETLTKEVIETVCKDVGVELEQ